jgi:hypothetical protein
MLGSVRLSPGFAATGPLMSIAIGTEVTGFELGAGNAGEVLITLPCGVFAMVHPFIFGIPTLNAPPLL